MPKKCPGKKEQHYYKPLLIVEHDVMQFRLPTRKQRTIDYCWL